MLCVSPCRPENEGIDDLLEAILLVTDSRDVRANRSVGRSAR
ncbi:MAG: hypothetical protein U0559_04620 [Anaerolineae bacterium]